MSARETPVMRQHAEVKRAYPDALIFFRLGDFYELFGDDAIIAAKFLDLTLTSRNKGAVDEIPMCGVPHHSAHAYLGKLLDAGHKVAICEQMADPAKCKGIVPRQVVRVLTPGLVTDQQQLESETNNWLVACDGDEQSLSLAALDLSTGELSTTTLANAALLLGELSRIAPREFLVDRAPLHPVLQQIASTLPRCLPRTIITLDEPLGTAEAAPELEGLADPGGIAPSEARVAARVLRFARRCTIGKKLPVFRLTRFDASDHLSIDEVTQAHLELTHSLRGDKVGTLLSVLGDTRTPVGARLIRRRILAPLRNPTLIRRRLDAVEALVLNPAVRAQLREHLAAVGDLERLATRSTLGEATPRDLGLLRDGLIAAAAVTTLLDEVRDGSFREALQLDTPPVDIVADLASELGRALTDNPPALAKEDAIFRADYDTELSELEQLRHHGAERISQLEASLRESTGISTLKVRYTRVFGWYIEVTRSHAGKAPKTWRRKQTIATGERFTTPELEDLAERMTQAEERYRERELELLRQLMSLAATAAGRIQTLAQRVARWDVASTMAELAHRYDYCRPSVDESLTLDIEEGRHPVVERLAAAGRFVPNDCLLDAEQQRLWLVTGPNMAGKSTFLRQTALIVIMAQMGSYVPARKARIGMVDRILSRLGASDSVARGESTFMVEMRETSRILHHATGRSLVILDEIGRGTSTYDGLAIAWAVAEHLDQAIACRTLFATHYHELTALAASREHIVNYNVTAKELGDDIVFLYQLAPGAASRSFGVAVAKLAELPNDVIKRAKALLEQLESPQHSISVGSCPINDSDQQLDLFIDRTPTEALKIQDELRRLNTERLTPIEALMLLDSWKRRLNTAH